jgi:hypothetical protein
VNDFLTDDRRFNIHDTMARVLADRDARLADQPRVRITDPDHRKPEETRP